MVTATEPRSRPTIIPRRYCRGQFQRSLRSFLGTVEASVQLRHSGGGMDRGGRFSSPPPPLGGGAGWPATNYENDDDEGIFTVARGEESPTVEQERSEHSGI
jgi:hypothetical protein